MTPETDTSFEPNLLDLHLGRLSPAEAQAVEERLSREPALAAEHAALTAVFAALRSASTPAPPADLQQRVVARVQTFRAMPRVATAPRTGDIDDVPNRGRLLRLGSMRDVLAIAAMIVIAVGLGTPALMQMRERSQRLVCSANLAQLGAGMQRYAATFNASLPFAGWDGRRSWQPTSDPLVTTMPNRRHVFPLLHAAFIADPRLFVCPSRQGMPMPREAVARSSDFLDSDNVSYAYQNMAGVRPSANDDGRLPIMADENPLFADGVPLLTPGRAPWIDPATANSDSHRGAGQNILTLSGEVRWTTTPASGLDDDNIWTLHGVSSYTGREGPAAATDSHLLK